MPIRATLVMSLALLVACNKDAGPGAEDTSLDAPELTFDDSDNDTIIDLHEGVEPDGLEDGAEQLVGPDSDGDGTPDYLDTDSDNDGIEDIIEAGDADPLTLPWDSDADGIEDFRDLDSDDNCINDADEGGADLDGDGIYDAADLDDDGDGIKDIYEIGESCAAPDSDGDGTPDYQDTDSDNDGVGDIYEGGTNPWQEEPVDTDGDGTPDYLDLDSDGDGFSDSDEGGVSSPDQEPRDTDGDGTYDFADTDSDGDGLSDDEEAIRNTDPYNSDTDNDGYTDGAEVAAGTDPRDPSSVIDGVYVTVEERVSVEEAFSFDLSVQLGDIAFLLDTTGSMSSTAQGMANQFSGIVSELTSTIPEAQYGVATYDDYNSGGYGSGQDKPFELRQQVTDDISLVQSTLSSIPIHSGNDAPESGMEALYQALTGTGYDQNCNGSYDSADDVKPFLSSGSDPFNGSGGQFYSSSSSGGGSVGGFGFRDYALPVVIYATDNNLRDPENGYGTPGGCPGDAGQSDVVAASLDTGAYLIGISVSGSTPVSQMNKLADMTGSKADTDGDGSADDRLVFTWNGSNSTQLRNTITDAIKDLVNSVQFSEITLEVEGDEWGFVTGIDPESYAVTGSADGQEVDFTLTFAGTMPASEEDQIYTLTLNVLGDGYVLLDTYDVYVVVPGENN